MVGLGNPGPRYRDTYHNAGKTAVAYFADKLPRGVAALPSSAFMNESGGFVKRALAATRRKPGELLVVHDDSDLPLGTYKLGFGRGDGGHQGVRSIIEALSTSAKGGSASGGKNFWRLRIGIRPPTDPASGRPKAGSFVLKKIAKEDADVLRVVFERALAEVTTLCASPQ